MNKREIISVGLVLMSGLFALPAAADAAVVSAFSPGKSIAYTNITDIAISIDDTVPVASLQIVKGKRRRVLVVQAAATGAVSTEYRPTLRVAINGGPPTSVPAEVTAVCKNDFAGAPAPLHPCTVSGMFFVDIDAAELATPGSFTNQPLDVTLHIGRDAASVPLTMDVVFSARLQKK